MFFWTVQDLKWKAAISQLTMPVRILAWENDNLHPLGLAQRMARMIPDAKLAVLPSLTEMFTDPSIIAAHYLRFLQDLEAKCE